MRGVVKSLYLAVAGAESGKSAIAAGLLEAMRRRAGRVGVFRPVVRAGSADPLLAFLDADVTGFGVSYDDVHADPDRAVATAVDRFHALPAGYEAMLIIGTDYTDVGASTELSFNARLALELRAPVLLVVSGRDRTPDEVGDAIAFAERSLSEQHCEVLGVVVNRAEPAQVDAVVAAAPRPAAAPLIGVVPEEPLLSAPTMGQLLRATSARLIQGADERLDREVLSVTVCAMTLPRVLENLSPDVLVITPGDRADVIVGAVLAHRSQTFPPLAGLLLSGGIDPDPPVQRLIEGLALRLPIAVTPLNTYEAASVTSTTHGALTDVAHARAGTNRKLDAALELFAGHVAVDDLLDRLDLHRSDVVTPMMFANDLAERARSQRRRIVLPEGTEPRVLRAAGQVMEDGIADIVLLGDPDAVRAAATAARVDIGAARIIDPHEETLRSRLATEYARVRAHKGVLYEAAYDAVVDESYCGTLMVALGMADGMVSGAVNTTVHTIRPALEVIGTVPGVSVVSSVFFMCLADRVLVYGDCAINPSPDAVQLADIAISSSRTAAAFGVEPRVAMLSYSTGASGRGSAVDTVREAVRLVRERAPRLQVEGPIQYDAAVDAGVAATKLPTSEVAGRATVFIFPDLNTGNNTYKAVQRSSGAVAVGPVLQGLGKPVNDLSRGATVADIVTTIAVTAVQAAQTAPADGVAS
jgi:phosphate acetyltransferase